MGLFFAGLFIGVLACVVGMMVRCVMWYEAKHPEDDYWHRGIRGLSSGVKLEAQETSKVEVGNAEGH